MKSFAGGLDGEESSCNVEDLSLIPGLGRSPGEGEGYPLQYYGLENFMDCIVHGISKSWTQLSDLHTYTHTHTHTHTHTQPMTSPGAFYREKEKLILKFIIQGTLNSKNNFEK